MKRRESTMKKENESIKPPKPSKKSNNIDWKRWVIFGSCFIVVFLFGIVLTRIYLADQSNFFRMENISRELVDLRSAMNIDSVRQYKIQKVLKIIESYNSNLSSAKAYDIANEIYEMEAKYTNLNMDLLCAVITHESGLTWDPEVVSKAGAMGLMQIMPVTGFFLAEFEGISWTKPEDVIFNPIYNIRMGSRFLSMLTEHYGLDGALAAYNGGEKKASLWLKNGKDDKFLWSETRKYIPAVRKLYSVYQADGL